MATTMDGLFGASPYEVEQQQYQKVQDAARQFAQMSPFEKAGMMMYQGGAGMGRMGAEALGGVNVAQQQAQQNQQTMQGADITTPEGLMQYAQKIKDISPARAAQAVAMARKMKEEDSQIKLREAQTQRALNYQSKDPETVQLLDKMTELESLGLQDNAEYKALEGRVKYLQTVKSSGGAGNSSTVQLVPGADGLMYRVEKGIGGRSEVATINGQPVTVAQYDATLKSRLAQAGAGGKEIGTQSAQAQMQLPKIEMQVTEVKNLGEKLFNHPGYQQFSGAKFPGLKALAGSNVPGAAALFGNIQGMAYLMSREELRGQGQVTEGEANMALAAFSRMNETMNEKDFKDAYADFVKRVENVRNLLKTRSSMAYQSPASGVSQTAIPIPEVTAPSATVPMPQGVPQAPTVAMPAPTGARQPFSLTTPQQVKEAYKNGKIDKSQANAILGDMKARGLF